MRKESKFPNKMSKRAEELLSGIKAGLELDRAEWASKLYGDPRKDGNVNSVCRTLRKHGYFIAPVGGYFQTGGKLKLFLQDPDEAKEVEQRYGKDITKRLETYQGFTPGMVNHHPQLHENVIKNMEAIMLLTLETKQLIATESHALLETSKKE